MLAPAVAVQDAKDRQPHGHHQEKHGAEGEADGGHMQLEHVEAAALLVKRVGMVHVLERIFGRVTFVDIARPTSTGLACDGQLEQNRKENVTKCKTDPCILDQHRPCLR